MTWTERFFLVLWCAHALVEFWLGKTRSTRAGSVLEVLMLILQDLVGGTKMPEVNATVKVSKETDEVLQLVAVIVSGLSQKKAVAYIAAGAMPLFIKAVDGIELVTQEYHEDPKTFCATCGERLGEILGGLIAAKQ